MSEWPGPWHWGRSAAGLAFRTPEMGEAEAAAVAGTVSEAGLEARRRRDLDEVIGAVSRAATGLAAPGSEAEEILGEELGWPEELARETLGMMARSWGAEALRALLAEELEDPGLLEGYRSQGARRRRASGPPLIFVVNAGNVPGVPVTAVVRGLLVRSGVLCKAPESEPGLLAAFARGLAAEDPLLGRAVATTWWPGSQAVPSWEEWCKRSGKVVVYGGSEAVGGVRERAPASADVVAYGPKVGVGAVLPDAAEGGGEWPERLARDVCAYEQQGCVSPRLLYAVDADPALIAERLGPAMEREVARLPRPVPDAGQAVAVRRLRAEAEFGAYREATEEEPPPRVLGKSDLSWSLVLESDRSPVTDVLPRVVRVKAASSVQELVEILMPLEGRIQAVGYAGTRGLEELAEGAARLGVSRLSPFGKVAWPPPDWRHDGRHQLLPLLRWTDREE